MGEASRADFPIPARTADTTDDEVRVVAAIRQTPDPVTWRAPAPGFPMRVTKCPWTEEWKKPGAPPTLGSPYQMLLSADYIQGANDNRRPDLMFEAAGQGVRFVTEMKPARQIVFDLVEEALAAFDDLCGLA